MSDDCTASIGIRQTRWRRRLVIHTRQPLLDAAVKVHIGLGASGADNRWRTRLLGLFRFLSEMANPRAAIELPLQVMSWVSLATMTIGKPTIMRFHRRDTAIHPRII